MNLSTSARMAFNTLKNKSWTVGRHQVGTGTLLGMGAVPLIEYHMARGEGHGIPYSMGKAVAWGGALLIAPHAAMAASIMTQTLPGLAYGGWSAYRNKQASLRKTVEPFSPDFRDNPFAMRERYMLQTEAMTSFRRSKSILGREASLMARRYG